MINCKSILAIIPARGGSKGVPRKNIRDLGGKPLMAWTIEEAKKSKYIDRLILSSEDAEIIDIARKWDCEVPFIRPKELAQDTTAGIDTVLHALTIFPQYQYVILLQVTSPFRTVQDIDDCIEQCIYKDADSCVSVTEADTSPYWMYKLDCNDNLSPLIQNDTPYLRRQDLPKVYSINGALYIAKTECLLQHKTFLNENTLAYKMSEYNSMDIDTEMDLFICQKLFDLKRKFDN